MEKPIKLSLIFIDKVSNIQSLINLVNKVAKESYEIKILNNKQVEVLSKTTQDYSTIVKELKKKCYWIPYL